MQKVTHFQVGKWPPIAYFCSHCPLEFGRKIWQHFASFSQFCRSRVAPVSPPSLSRPNTQNSNLKLRSCYFKTCSSYKNCEHFASFSWVILKSSCCPAPIAAHPKWPISNGKFPPTSRCFQRKQSILKPPATGRGSEDSQRSAGPAQPALTFSTTV